MRSAYNWKKRQRVTYRRFLLRKKKNKNKNTVSTILKKVVIWEYHKRISIRAHNPFVWLCGHIILLCPIPQIQKSKGTIHPLSSCLYGQRRWMPWWMKMFTGDLQRQYKHHSEYGKPAEGFWMTVTKEMKQTYYHTGAVSLVSSYLRINFSLIPKDH